MFFSRPERKKKHPMLWLMGGAFALIGIGSLITASKNAMAEGIKKVKGLFCKCGSEGQKAGQDSGAHE